MGGYGGNRTIRGYASDCWVANAPLGSLNTWVTLGYSVVELLVEFACAKVTMKVTCMIA